MTKKQIRLSEGEIRSMSYEEVLEQFKQMLNKFANNALEKIVFNKPEKEEVMQELRIQVWNAYRRYDIDSKNNFSTYLHYYLQGGIHRATSKLYAQKRTNEKGTVSLNKMIGGGGGEAAFEDLFGRDDLEIASLEFREFVTQLENMLEPCEKKVLLVLLDKGDYSVQDLANELGMSRQGANKKVNRFKEKMAALMIELGFAVNKGA